MVEGETSKKVREGGGGGENRVGKGRVVQGGLCRLRGQGWARRMGKGRGGGVEGVSGTPARIPSRLGEPGSLFSRYKFLQLRLVVVMLLTRTRRELLKR